MGTFTAASASSWWLVYSVHVQYSRGRPRDRPGEWFIYYACISSTGVDRKDKGQRFGALLGGGWRESSPRGEKQATIYVVVNQNRPGPPCNLYMNSLRQRHDPVHGSILGPATRSNTYVVTLPICFSVPSRRPWLNNYSVSTARSCRIAEENPSWVDGSSK